MTFTDYEFKNDFHVSMETDLEKMFVEERNTVATQKELDVFVSRWGDILPEMRLAVVQISDFLLVRDSREKQSEAVKDPSLRYLLNFILPSTLLKIVFVARHYQVSTGLALLQMINGNCFVLENDQIKGK